MKYKIGDKVRVMPWGTIPSWATPTPYIGWVGTIGNTYCHHEGNIGRRYKVIFNNNRYEFYFEKELELAVKPGEQMLFDFMLPETT